MDNVGLHINCPHCHHAVEIVGVDGHDEVTCDSCGRSFTPHADATVAWQPPTDGTPGAPKSLKHLEFLEKLGEGAYGAVWKARDRRLQRLVAVKIPRRGNLAPEDVDKFLREARAAAQLQHPNIVGIHEAGQEGDTVYIVSDFIDGLTLADWLKARKPDADEAAALCRKLAAALHYAHEHGVVHRDLKPANVMMDRGDEPHIMDFGLAKRDAGEITMTVEGSILGTPAYMSPEQARGEGHNADRRSDIYSLGVMLFELLTGERPFRGEQMMLLVQVIEDDPPPVRRLNSRVSRDLETICAKCLEKPPERRYATAADLADDLGHNLAGEPIHARPVGRVEWLWRWCRRKPALASLISTASLLLLAVAIVSTVAYFREARLTEQAQRSEANAEDEALHAKQSEAHAIDEAAHARMAEAKAEDEAARATQSEQEAQQSLYYGNIALAYRYIDEGDVEEACRLLDRCPAAYRHWEWSFLSDVARRDRRFILAKTQVQCFALSADGRWIAVGTEKGELILWDDTARKVLFRKVTGDTTIKDVAVSPDGSRVATAGAADTAKIWSAPNGDIAFELQGHTGSGRHGLAFSPDGRSLATVGTDNTVRIWNALSGKLARSLASTRPSAGLAWQDDSQRLFVLESNGDVVCWDTSTGERSKVFNAGSGPPPNGIACSADGGVLATAMGDGGRVWSLSEAKPIRVFYRGAAACGDVALSRDGQTVALHAYAVGGRVFDVKSGKPLYRTGHATRGIALSADAAHVVVGRYGGGIGILPARLRMSTLEIRPDMASVNTEGGYIASTMIPARNAVYESATGAKVLSIQGSFSADQRFLFRVDESGVLHIHDAATGFALRKIALGATDKIRAWTISRDGKYVVAADDSPSVRVLSLENGQVMATVGKDANWPLVRCLTFAPHGDVLAVGHLDCSVRLWHWRTGESRELPEKHLGVGDGAGGVRSLAFSADGKYLASGGSRGDRTIRVGRTATGQCLHVLTGHLAGIESLDFSRDGRRLLSGGEDGTIRVWDPVLGQEILQLEASEGRVWSAYFTEDESSIVAMVESGTGQMWGGLSTPLPAGKSIDLLPWLRRSVAEKPADAGSAGETRLSTKVRRVVPISLAPAGSYVLRGKFTRTRSGEIKTVGFLLPAGQGKAMLALDHHERATSGLDLVEKHGVGDPQDQANPTNCPVTLVDGRTYSFEARVELKAEQVTVTVQLDGQEIIRWQGPQRALSMSPGWETPDSRMMGFALGVVDVTVEQLELVPLDSNPRLLEPLPQRATPPPGVTVVTAPGTVDLLPLVDTEHGTLDATLEQTDQDVAVQSEEKKFGRVCVPVWPRGGYELSGSFTLPEKATPVIIFPTARSRGAVVWLNARDGSSALSKLDGMGGDDPANPTRVSPSKVEVGKRHAFRVRVVGEGDEADVTVELDGEPYIHWKGPESAISLYPAWDMPHQRTLGMGVQDGRVIYHELKLKMLDGEAWILKPAVPPEGAGHVAAPAEEEK